MKYLNSLQLYIEKNCSYTVGLFAHAFVHNDVNLSLSQSSELFPDVPFICSHDTLFPINLFTCRVPNKCFLFITSQFFIATVPALVASKSK